MSRLIRCAAVILLGASLSGCFLTKLVTVPMRAVGAGVSVVPVVGNQAHDAIDKVAETFDEIPI